MHAPLVAPGVEARVEQTDDLCATNTITAPRWLPPSLQALRPVRGVGRREVTVKKKSLSSVPPPPSKRPTPIALREMAKIRRVLGFPPLPEKI